MMKRDATEAVSTAVVEEGISNENQTVCCAYAQILVFD